MSHCFVQLLKCNSLSPSLQEKAGNTALTWALFDAKSPIGVLGIVIVLQLEGGRIVYKSLGALRDTCTTVIEIHTGLQNKGEETIKFNHIAAFVWVLLVWLVGWSFLVQNTVLMLQTCCNSEECDI